MATFKARKAKHPQVGMACDICGIYLPSRHYRVIDSGGMTTLCGACAAELKSLITDEPQDRAVCTVCGYHVRKGDLIASGRRFYHATCFAGQVRYRA